MKSIIIALCDKQVESFLIENEVEESNVPVKRIPMSANNKQRLTWTQKVLNEIQPDWISLQYVTYSFNPKGLPFWLPSFFEENKTINGIICFMNCGWDRLNLPLDIMYWSIATVFS
jgi:hypothetical protein